tara:strand:+ start:211 stop:411 length:201 start_codon:yes stop_codon:yes gene_type:complete
MSDYIVDNKTFFLSGSRIFVTNNDKVNGVEMTLDWFLKQDNINLIDVLDISYEVSGSKTYPSDRGW